MPTFRTFKKAKTHKIKRTNKKIKKLIPTNCREFQKEPCHKITATSWQESNTKLWAQKTRNSTAKKAANAHKKKERNFVHNRVFQINIVFYCCDLDVKKRKKIGSVKKKDGRLFKKGKECQKVSNFFIFCCKKRESGG